MWPESGHATWRPALATLPRAPRPATIRPMIYRIDVRTTPAARGGSAAADPVGEALRHQIAEFGSNVGRIETSRIFLIDTDADTADVQRVASELLADPVVDRAELVASGP